MESIKRLRDFVIAMTRLVESNGANEAVMLKQGGRLLADLVAHDDWLPEEFARADAKTYRQYLLHCDPLERFSVVSFVWGPGQTTPIHDHTVWGLIGMMRGSERCVEYARPATGHPMKIMADHVVKPGEIDTVSPSVGDIHTVSNALADRPSISIHVYGANIGAVHRQVYVAETGEAKPFISGYSNLGTPNLWGYRAEAGARA